MENYRSTIGAAIRKTLSRKKIVAVLFVAVIVYLWNVFIAQFTLQETAWENPWLISKSLGCDVTKYSMRPQPDRPPKEGYQQDANVWLLQSHPSAMYTSEILSDPKCLGAMLADGSNVNVGFVLLIYDFNKKKVIFRIQKY